MTQKVNEQLTIKERGKDYFFNKINYSEDANLRLNIEIGAKLVQTIADKNGTVLLNRYKMEFPKEREGSTVKPAAYRIYDLSIGQSERLMNSVREIVFRRAIKDTYTNYFEENLPIHIDLLDEEYTREPEWPAVTLYRNGEMDWDKDRTILSSDYRVDGGIVKKSMNQVTAYYGRYANVLPSGVKSFSEMLWHYFDLLLQGGFTPETQRNMRAVMKQYFLYSDRVLVNSGLKVEDRKALGHWTHTSLGKHYFIGCDSLAPIRIAMACQSVSTFVWFDASNLTEELKLCRSCHIYQICARKIGFLIKKLSSVGQLYIGAAGYKLAKEGDTKNVIPGIVANETEHFHPDFAIPETSNYHADKVKALWSGTTNWHASRNCRACNLGSYEAARKPRMKLALEQLDEVRKSDPQLDKYFPDILRGVEASLKMELNGIAMQRARVWAYMPCNVFTQASPARIFDENVERATKWWQEQDEYFEENPEWATKYEADLKLHYRREVRAAWRNSPITPDEIARKVQTLQSSKSAASGSVKLTLQRGNSRPHEISSTSKRIVSMVIDDPLAFTDETFYSETHAEFVERDGKYQIAFATGVRIDIRKPRIIAVPHADMMNALQVTFGPFLIGSVHNVPEGADPVQANEHQVPSYNAINKMGSSTSIMSQVAQTPMDAASCQFSMDMKQWDMSALAKRSLTTILTAQNEYLKEVQSQSTFERLGIKGVTLNGIPCTMTMLTNEVIKAFEKGLVFTSQNDWEATQKVIFGTASGIPPTFTANSTYNAFQTPKIIEALNNKLVALKLATLVILAMVIAGDDIVIAVRTIDESNLKEEHFTQLFDILGDLPKYIGMSASPEKTTVWGSEFAKNLSFLHMIIPVRPNLISREKSPQTDKYVEKLGSLSKKTALIFLRDDPSDDSIKVMLAISHYRMPLIDERYEREFAQANAGAMYLPTKYGGVSFIVQQNDEFMCFYSKLFGFEDEYKAWGAGSMMLKQSRAEDLRETQANILIDFVKKKPGVTVTTKPTQRLPHASADNIHKFFAPQPAKRAQSEKALEKIGAQSSKARDKIAKFSYETIQHRAMRDTIEGIPIEFQVEPAMVRRIKTLRKGDIEMKKDAFKRSVVEDDPVHNLAEPSGDFVFHNLKVNYAVPVPVGDRHMIAFVQHYGHKQGAPFSRDPLKRIDSALSMVTDGPDVSPVSADTFLDLIYDTQLPLTDENIALFLRAMFGESPKIAEAANIIKIETNSLKTWMTMSEIWTPSELISDNVTESFTYVTTGVPRFGVEMHFAFKPVYLVYYIATGEAPKTLSIEMPKEFRTHVFKMRNRFNRVIDFMNEADGSI